MKLAIAFAGFVLLCAITLPQVALRADDWPAFRGSHYGTAADKDLPVEWSKDNILWKIKLPGVGASSPITAGDRVYVTCYSGYGTTLTKGMSGGGFGPGGFGPGGGFGKGKKGGFGGFGGANAGEQKKLKLHLVCLDRRKGEVVWQKEIQPKLPEASFTGFLRDHGYTTNTPATDGEHIYVFFGKTGVLAFDRDGKQLWQTSVGTKTNMWGTGASPVLWKDLVLVNASIESGCLVALNKKSGKEIWRTKGLGTSWSSPIVVRTKEGKDEVVVSLPGKVIGYDPENGKELWQCQGIGRSGGGGGRGGFGGGGFGGGGFGGMGGGYTCSTPVARDGIIYVIGGGGPTQPAALAIKSGGRGDVTKTNVLWRKSIGTAIASPVLCGDFLCWVSGTAMCVNLKDGKVAHRERLYSGMNEYVSAVSAGDRVYALTRFDGVYVLGVGAEKLDKLAHNTFEDDSTIFNASPAISDGQLYIRSSQYLYCIGKKQGR
jgi:outer membrane protein assembly factor BamB